MALASPRPLSSEPPGTLRELVDGELRLEDARILAPLLARLGRMGDELDRGENVAPGELSRGLELLDRYDQEVHAPRVREVLGLLPKHEGPAGTSSPGAREKGLFHRRRTRQLRQPEGLALEFDRIVHGERTSVIRVSALRSFVDAYGSGGWGARERLASVLKGYLVADRAWARSEREYVLHALKAELPPDLDRKVREAVAEIARARAALERDVEEYVETPVELRTAARQAPARAPTVPRASGP